jgi:hypothetical protein
LRQVRKKELVSLLCEDNLRNIKMKKWRSTKNIRIEHPLSLSEKLNYKGKLRWDMGTWERNQPS